MPTVVKPFNTTARRFRTDDEVRETDDLAPHTFADLVERGFVAGPAKASAPAKVPPRKARGRKA